MKIYNLPPSEGLRVIIAYQCDECGDLESGEDLPESWLEDGNTHYCLSCQHACLKCEKLFSVKYIEDYFSWGLCENCQNNLSSENITWGKKEMKIEKAIKLISDLQLQLNANILAENLYIIKYGEQTDYISISDALETIENILRRKNEEI